MSADKQTKRDALVEYIVEKIKAMSVPEYTQGYRVVTRDPIAHEHGTKIQPGEAIIGVYDVGEEKTIMSSATNCQLEVVLEFYYKPKLGSSKSSDLNRLMGDLQYCMRKDYNQGGYAINTTEVSNNIDIDGIFDKIINGSIKFEVQYRHGVFNPYTDVC